MRTASMRRKQLLYENQLQGTSRIYFTCVTDRHNSNNFPRTKYVPYIITFEDDSLVGYSAV